MVVKASIIHAETSVTKNPEDVSLSNQGDKVEHTESASPRLHFHVFCGLTVETW